MECKHCGSGHIQKKGYRYSKYKTSQRYTCFTCNKQFSILLSEELINTRDLPRILLFDIETAPMEVFVWGLYKQFIPHTNVIKDWFVLSWSAKWLYEDKILSAVVTSEEAKNRDDGRILGEIWKLLDEADVIIGHNVDRFDDRKLKARFIVNEMMPPSPYKSVDTLKVARKEFAFVSYKQDFLTKYFDLQNKLSTDFQLWRDCVAGKEKALARMLDYNEHDVIGLEQVYLKLMPYIKNHPNLGVMMNETVCPNCGSDHLEETKYYYYTAANKFRVHRCMNCKAVMRSKKKANSKQTEVRSVPK